MAQLFINIIGHNASGKTTLSDKLAKSFKINQVNGDAFRKFVYDHVAYFQDTDLSFPSKKGGELNPLTILYRIELAKILLQSGENVLFDGSGFTLEHRNKYLNEITRVFPKVTRVIIWADIEEADLLERLRARDQKSGAQWVRMYKELRKQAFVPPINGEVEVLIRYDQHNYEEVRQQIKDLLQ